MSALGSLVVKLALEHAEFTKGLDKSSQEALRFAKNTQGAVDNAVGSFKNLALQAVGLTAAFVGVSNVLGGFSRSITQLAALDDLTQKTGAAVETLSRMQKVAIQFNADFGLIEGSLVKLSRGIGDLDQEGGKANTALKALGLSGRDLSGNLRDPADLMIEIAKRLQNYQDGASKAAIATDLFGKSGAELLPYLNDLAENVDRFSGASAEAAARAAAFEDNLNGIKEKASSAFETLAINALPTLDAMLSKFIENAEKGRVFLGVLESIGELGKSAFFGSAKSRQQDRFNFGLPAEMNAVATKLKNQSLSSLDRIKLNNELTFLAKEYNALALQLGKVEQKVAEDSVAKPALNYSSNNGESAARDAKNLADKAAREAQARYDAELKAIQEMVDEELEATDAITSYQMKRDEERAEALKKLDEEELKRKERVMDILQDQATRNFDEAQRQQKELADDAKRQVQDLSRSLTDALLRTFEAGEGGAKAFLKNLANIFKARVFQVGIEFVLSKTGLSSILATFSSLLSGTASASSGSAGGGGGLSGIFSSVKDFFGGGNSSIVGAIENLGSIIANGNGGLLDSIGGFMGSNSAAIADGFGYLGAALQLAQGNIGGALGTAVGTFFGGPIGGAIGSFLGGALGGLFGGGLPPRVFSGQSTTLTDDGFIQQLVRGPKSSWKAGGANDGLGKLNEQVLTTINTLFKSFNVAGQLSAFSAVSKKKSADAQLTVSLDGKEIANNYTGKIKDGSLQQAFDMLSKTSYKAVVQAVQASGVSDGVKKFFDEITSNEQVVDAVNTLSALNTSLAGLPPVFNAIRQAIDTTEYTTGLDQLKSQFQAIQTYTSLFYTEQENFATYTKQLTSQFDALNQVIPATRDEYRQLVDGIVVVDEASRDQFNALVALAPAMDTYYKQLQQQADGINEVNRALAEGLDKNLFSTFAEYQTYKGLTANYGEEFARDYTANFKAGLITRDASGRAFVANNPTADLVTEVKRLQIAQEAQVVQMSEVASILRKFDRFGMPVERPA